MGFQTLAKFYACYLCICNFKDDAITYCCYIIAHTSNKGFEGTLWAGTQRQVHVTLKYIVRLARLGTVVPVFITCKFEEDPIKKKTLYIPEAKDTMCFSAFRHSRSATCNAELMLTLWSHFEIARDCMRVISEIRALCCMCKTLSNICTTVKS